LETGIVYKTDASSSDKVKIIETATEESHQPIVYPVAVLTGTKQQKAAEDFLAYLDDPASKSVFEKYGFILLK
jgi:molybdate transport system substrate-binding protein